MVRSDEEDVAAGSSASTVVVPAAVSQGSGAFAAEIVAEAQSVQTTCVVAPWIDNASYPAGKTGSRDNNLSVPLSPCDFERQGWKIFHAPGSITIPFLGGGEKHIMGYRIVGLHPESREVWLPMSPDEAEQHKTLNGVYQLYGHCTFTVTEVVGVEPEDHPDYAKNKKYMDMGGNKAATAVERMVPLASIRIEDDEIDLYAYLDFGMPRGNMSKDRFRYITTINISGAD